MDKVCSPHMTLEISKGDIVKQGLKFYFYLNKEYFCLVNGVAEYKKIVALSLRKGWLDK